MPSVPKNITVPKDRANYLAVHFWENFNVSDPTLINNKDITEQAFVNLISIFGIAEEDSVVKGYKELFKISSKYPQVTQYFLELGEKYFYEKPSPYRNDALFSKYIQSSNLSTLDDAHQFYWNRLCSLSEKNNPGNKAIDFQWTSSDGEYNSLYNVKSDYALILFIDPDCEDCALLKKKILSAPLPIKCKVIAIYPGDDEDLWKQYSSTAQPSWINGWDNITKIIDNDIYDINTFPVIYLLDKDKRVILKDTTLDAIIDYFKKCPTE